MTIISQSNDLQQSLKFKEYNRLIAGVEGWFTKLAVATCDGMLSYQEANNVRADMLEIGAYHGRSAILWLLHARQGETLHVIDIEARPPLQNNMDRVAKQIDSKYSLVKASSYKIPDSELIARQRRAFRLIHIDGDHTAAGIYNDLDVCANLLHLRGVMVVDDFMNPRFPQITEVTYNFLAQRPYEFSLIASGANKGFIVRAKFYDFWIAFFRNHLPLVIKEHKAEITEGTAGARICFGIRPVDR